MRPPSRFTSPDNDVNERGSWAEVHGALELATALASVADWLEKIEEASQDMPADYVVWLAGKAAGACLDVEDLLSIPF